MEPGNIRARSRLHPQDDVVQTLRDAYLSALPLHAQSLLPAPPFHSLRTESPWTGGLRRSLPVRKRRLDRRVQLDPLYAVGRATNDAKRVAVSVVAVTRRCWGP